MRLVYIMYIFMTWRGVGVRPIMMYDNDREGGLKDLDIMLMFKQEIHKKGEVFAWKCKNSTILV